MSNKLFKKQIGKFDKQIDTFKNKIELMVAERNELLRSTAIDRLKELLSVHVAAETNFVKDIEILLSGKALVYNNHSVITNFLNKHRIPYKMESEMVVHGDEYNGYTPITTYVIILDKGASK